MRYAKPLRGFTLVEMIVVIVITGIIAGMVAMFLRAPMQGYLASARRAEMADIADTALRRLARDIRTAVPNSVRLPTATGSSYVEFLPTRDGGRYHVNATGGAAGCGGVAGDVAGAALVFGTTDTCFAILGAPMDFTAGDAIVIGSTQSPGDLPYMAPATAGSITRMIPAAGAGVGRSTVQFTPGAVFPTTAQKEGHRFEVVPAGELAVTYACTGTAGVDANGDGTMRLMRYWAYGIHAAQQTPVAIAANTAPVTAHSAALLADKVSNCNFVYSTLSQRNSLVAATLELTQGGETVRLYHEIHINNIP